MFNRCEGKRICREDLLSPHSSRASSPAEGITASYVTTILRDTYSSLETFDAQNLSSGNQATDQEPVGDAEEEQEFEFRLFRAPALPTASPRPKEEGPRLNNAAEGDAKVVSSNEGVKHADAGIKKLRIRIRSPTPSRLDVGEEGGFVVPSRSWDYYFSDPGLAIRTTQRSDEKEREGPGSGAARQGAIDRFVDAAVNGEEVLERARTKWPGCHLPWRVIHLQYTPGAKPSPTAKSTTLSPNTLSTVATTPTTPHPKSGNKPGKKRRIILRKRLSAAQAMQDADREKRTRRNREKKLKRRQKNRDKKAAICEATGGDVKEESGSVEDGEEKWR